MYDMVATFPVCAYMQSLPLPELRDIAGDNAGGHGCPMTRNILTDHT